MAVFLCSEFVIMSEVTVITTVPPVTVVCSGVYTTIMTATIALTFMSLAAASGQDDVVLLPPLIPRNTVRDVVGFATVLQLQPQPQMPY